MNFCCSNGESGNIALEYNTKLWSYLTKILNAEEQALFLKKSQSESEQSRVKLATDMPTSEAKLVH